MINEHRALTLIKPWSKKEKQTNKIALKDILRQLDKFNVLIMLDKIIKLIGFLSVIKVFWLCKKWSYPWYLHAIILRNELAWCL